MIHVLQTVQFDFAVLLYMPRQFFHQGYLIPRLFCSRSSRITHHSSLSQVGGEVEGKITRNEFDVYYFNVSASIDRDDYFEAVIRSAWHVSTVASGEGWNPRRQVALRDVRDSRDREREVAPDDFDDEFAVSQQYEVERGRHGPASQGRGGSYSRGGGSGGAGGSYGAGSAPSYGPSSSSGYGPRSSRGRSTSPSATRSSSSPRPLSPGGVGGPSSNRPIVY